MTAHSVPETTCTGSHITSGFIFPSGSTTGQNASSYCTTLVQLHQPGAEDSRGHDLDNQEEGAHRSEEHTSELQSRLHLVCRLLLEKKQRRNEEHTSELQSRLHLVCRLLLEKKKTKT